MPLGIYKFIFCKYCIYKSLWWTSIHFNSVMINFVVFALQILCVVAAVFAVIMYRIIIVTVLYASSDDIIRQNAKITTTCTAAMLNLVAIMILNKVSLDLYPTTTLCCKGVSNIFKRFWIFQINFDLPIYSLILK